MLPFFFSFVLLISFFAFLNSNENVSFIKLAKFQTGEFAFKQKIKPLAIKLAVYRCIAPILPLTRQRSDYKNLLIQSLQRLKKKNYSSWLI